MDKHSHLSQNLEQVISKDDSASSVMSDSEEDSGLRPLLTFREKLSNILHSHKFQVSIIVLVILDCLLVIAELLIDIKILELHETDNPAPHVLHYMSIGILSIFIVEIAAKVYAFRLEFFRHKLEVFDAFVVFLSFALDVAFREEESVTNGFGLVIMMRLWRVARILNGVVLSVKTQAEHKLLKERQHREGIEQELMKCRDYVSALEQEVEMLRQLLLTHGIKEVPPSVIENNSPPPNTISVVAEVNHIQST